MDFTAFIPDFALLGLAVLILAVELGGENRLRVFPMAGIGLLVVSALLALVPSPEGSRLGGLVISSSNVLWKQVFTAAALGTVLVARSYFREGGNLRGTLAKPGAFLGLLMLCAFGMFTLVSARDLLTFYLSLELATLPLYALAAFQPREGESAEAGSKYVLMGGFASALSLFGISLLYGFCGSLGFDALGEAVRLAPNQPLLSAGVFFLLAGLGFKLSMAPLHMWAPDVYEGAPSPVMAFLSVGSKAAGVAALAALFFGPLDALRPGLTGVFAGAAVLSMVVGNLGAMRQSNLRRFVAYSSIAQAGYMIVALVGDAEPAKSALLYNLVVYGVSNFGLFFLMGIIGKHGPEDMDSLRGLSRRSPALAVLLVMVMFSLAGIPPLAGFLGKFLLFSVAVEAGHYVLVALAVGNAVVSFFYYMALVKEAYIKEPDGQAAPIGLSAGQKFAAFGLMSLLLILGMWPGLMDRLAGRGGF